MIAVESVSKSFPVKGGPDVEAVQVGQPDDRRQRVLHAARPLRLRQDHAAAAASPASRRRPAAASASTARAMAALPPHEAAGQHRVPELRAVPAYDRRATMSRFGLRDAERAATGDRGSAWPKRSTMVGLPRSSATARRRSFRAASGSAWRSPARWSPKPRVLLLDEPLSALDLKLREQMQVELKRLQRELGITFVLVTHDQEEALAMSDRIAVMIGGNVAAGRRAARHLRQSANAASSPTSSASPICCRAATLGRGAGITIAVRPEKVRLSIGAGKVQGTVAAITFLGLDTVYDVILSGGTRSKRGCATTRRRSRPAPQSASTGRTTPSGSCSIERAGRDAQKQRPGADRADDFSSSAFSW